MRVCRFGFGIWLFVYPSAWLPRVTFPSQVPFPRTISYRFSSLRLPRPVTLLRTWGYAGGTNINGSLISPGGFDPILSVFDATGGLLSSSALIDSNDDDSSRGN